MNPAPPLPKKRKKFQVTFDIEGQGQSTQKSIWILTKVFLISGSN